MLPERAIVELTHLHFLRLLVAGRAQGRYVVKGGCNLRFFFGSVRYSEDLDLDARDVPQAAVVQRVESVLASVTWRESLQASGILVRRVTAPKQTETTQRWKLELGISGREGVLRTKIECSRRGSEDEAAVEAVDPRLVQRYRTLPVIASHYTLEAAIRQKVGALVGRREVQARDVFDLRTLFTRLGGGSVGLAVLRPKVAAAIERVWQLGYADYAGQVVAFLEPDHAEALGTPQAWEAMQLEVVTALEQIGSAS